MTLRNSTHRAFLRNLQNMGNHVSAGYKDAEIRSKPSHQTNHISPQIFRLIHTLQITYLVAKQA